MKAIIFFSQRISSFGFALAGIRNFFLKEANAWLHLAATLAVLIISLHYRVSAAEAIALTIVIGLVWISEAFNTVVERTMDLISPQKDPRVAFIKDLSAGAVLLAALTALVTGCIIFIPKII